MEIPNPNTTKSKENPNYKIPRKKLVIYWDLGFIW
jgi:hypothetical protein